MSCTFHQQNEAECRKTCDVCIETGKAVERRTMKRRLRELLSTSDCESLNLNDLSLDQLAVVLKLAESSNDHRD